MRCLLSGFLDLCGVGASSASERQRIDLRRSLGSLCLAKWHGLVWHLAIMGLLYSHLSLEKDSYSVFLPLSCFTHIPRQALERFDGSQPT